MGRDAGNVAQEATGPGRKGEPSIPTPLVSLLLIETPIGPSQHRGKEGQDCGYREGSTGRRNWVTTGKPGTSSSLFQDLCIAFLFLNIASGSASMKLGHCPLLSQRTERKARAPSTAVKPTPCFQWVKGQYPRHHPLPPESASASK